jgi:hypothetical protein
MIPESSHRVRFIPEINLGHLVSAGVFLVTAGVGWATLNSRVTTLEDRAHDQKEAIVGVETRLLTRITEQRAAMDQTQVRTADDIREMKMLLRDGFRDLDQKLERKMDKPTR